MWTVLAVLVLAALGALVAIAVSRGDDGGTKTVVATRLPARTTVATLPVFGTETAVTTVLLPPIEVVGRRAPELAAHAASKRKASG